jgi:type II secretory pathway pseudopilin PulG
MTAPTDQPRSTRRSEDAALHRPTGGRFGRRARAFTLAEVLATLAVIATLAVLLIPAASKSITGAQMVQSTNNLRQLVTANLAYAADNGAFCPADDRRNNRRWHGARASSKAPFDPAKGYLANYLGQSGRVTECPMFKEMTKSNKSFEEGTGGYGYNAAYLGGTPSWAYNADGSRHSASLGQVQRSHTAMFTTSGYATGGSLQEYPYCEPPFWDFGDGPTEWRPSPTVHFRFGGKALVGWLDGRVTAEPCEPRAVGFNPHDGDASAQKLGWFGPDRENGFWNPARSEP